MRINRMIYMILERTGRYYAGEEDGEMQWAPEVDAIEYLDYMEAAQVRAELEKRRDPTDCGLLVVRKDFHRRPEGRY